MGPENSALDLQNAAAEIRRIYNVNPSVSASAIETYLEERLKSTRPEEKLSCVRGLARLFEAVPAVQNPALTGHETGEFSDQKEYAYLFTLLFGKNISKFDLSSREHLEKLAKSLNTIFDSLNQIIGVIHATLLGEQTELETIRHIIGSGVGSQEKTDSLQTYLDQIQRAFLVAHRAYQEAAINKVKQILEEISPEKIAESVEGGLKFGPLRKAELFESYKDKHALCQKWVESGRLAEELLRDFEKICQKLYYS